MAKAGADALTLDMIAAEAPINKGGLTYSFAAKRKALVEDFISFLNVRQR